MGLEDFKNKKSLYMWYATLLCELHGQISPIHLNVVDTLHCVMVVVVGGFSLLVDVLTHIRMLIKLITFEKSPKFFTCLMMLCI